MDAVDENLISLVSGAMFGELASRLAHERQPLGQREICLFHSHVNVVSYVNKLMKA